MAEEPKKKVKLKVSGARSTKAAAEDAAADRESMGQVRKSLVFLAFVVVAYVAYLVFSGQFDEFVTSLAGVDLGWVTAGVVCFLFYYVFGVLAYVLSVIADPDSPVGIRDLMSVEASGVFFMRLTPNGAAAPPAQIYRLTRAGLSVGQASALNFTRFVLYEAGEGVFAAIMLLFCGNYFYEQFGDVTLIGLFLFGFKVVQVGAVLFLCLFPKPVMAIGNWALRFANRHGWLSEKKFNKYYEMVNTQVMEFAGAFRSACGNVGEMLATEVVTLLQLGCMYALPFFVLRAFGEPADLIVCLSQRLHAGAAHQRHPASRRHGRRGGGFCLPVPRHVRPAPGGGLRHLACRRVPAAGPYRRALHGHALQRRREHPQALGRPLGRLHRPHQRVCGDGQPQGHGRFRAAGSVTRPQAQGARPAREARREGLGLRHGFCQGGRRGKDRRRQGRCKKK